MLLAPIILFVLSLEEDITMEMYICMSILLYTRIFKHGSYSFVWYNYDRNRESQVVVVFKDQSRNQFKDQRRL